MKILSFLLLLVGTASWSLADLPAMRPQEGLRENAPNVHALTKARLVPRPGEVIESGNILVRNGLIVAIGSNVPIPENARIWDLSGLTIYSGFIDAYAQFGKELESPKQNQPAHWNTEVFPQRSVLDAVTISQDDVKKRRELGFTTAHLVPTGGIFSGKGAVVQMTAPEAASFVLKRRASQHLAFVTLGSTYPKSLMGCLALIRQTLSDADWYRRYKQVYKQHPNEIRPGEHVALNALAATVSRKEPVFFHLGDEADVQRALAIADQYKLRRVLVDSGHGYRQAKRFRRSGTELVLSIDFPEAPIVSAPDRALDVSLEKMQHWEQAPTNAAVLHERGVKFALSTHRLGSKLNEFWPNVRRAIQHGLDEQAAIEALTSAPARMLGESARLGEISNGRLANLVVTDGNPFREKEAKIRQVWVDGHPWYSALERAEDSPVGTWEAAWTGVIGPERLAVSGSNEKPKVKVGDDGATVDLVMAGSDEFSFTLPSKHFGFEEGQVRLNAYLNAKTMAGQGVLPDGQRLSWSAKRLLPEDRSAKEQKLLEAISLNPVDQYPAGAYPGKLPGMNLRKRRVFIENATIWTCGPRGILTNANVVIEDGRIIAIGSEVQAPKRSYTIDGKGKHITPGLVDCHSHTAISRGVNEGSHAVTCEVRIGDVLDPTDISIYRQLAGGLTTANLLHGSANPMGGQSQVIKLRWGHDAEGLKLRGAKPGVKFALGENVKQSNWGSRSNNRYPQSRMGVEQLMRDTFLAAREYGERKQHHAEQEKAVPFRSDFRLDAVLEILRGERIVHIHSYRQDEILMFVRLAQEFGFTVGTFQHVLEGYKVARHLREINAGASTFSDWWAYKFEVYDAIPYNGALLHSAGVITSFNSDDNELATRMNTEAAKAVKYGGVSPEEALKFVTINPAKQLRIANRIGSLEEGKDADFVVWSGPPLSTLSRCEQTWIDGVPYFQRSSQTKRRQWVEVERRRLVGKILKESEGSEKEDKPKDDKAEETQSIAERLRLLSPWGQYQQIDYQSLYHDGQSLHACTGCYCEFR